MCVLPAYNCGTQLAATTPPLFCLNDTVSSISRAECGIESIVDMWNVTLRAALQVPDIEEFSYDCVHWGPEMNLVKAALLLMEVSSGSRSSRAFP